MRPGAEAIMKGDAGHIRKVYALLQDRTRIAIPAMERLLADLS